MRQPNSSADRLEAGMDETRNAIHGTRRGSKNALNVAFSESQRNLNAANIA
jgi:hypothetical protein